MVWPSHHLLKEISMAMTAREASGSGTDSEGGYRRLPVGEDGDVGYYDGGRGEPILLVHAGVFSDWFRPLSLQLPRDRFRVVRLRRAGYRDSAPPAGHLTFVQATIRPALETFFAGDLGGAFDRFMRGIGGPGYPDVLTSQLGPVGLEAARAESSFFFADELPAVTEWVFGPAQAARVTQPALIVLGGDSPRLTPLMAETVQRLSVLLPRGRTQTLPGCSHLMPLQQPAELTRLITAFAGTIPRPAPAAGMTTGQAAVSPA
jgi:pimeloyl-ACP methyl ester carboxylesterase